MSRTRSLNSICDKKSAIYSKSDILDAMDEAHSILNASAKKVWADDVYMRRVVKAVVEEYEYVFRGVLKCLNTK